VIALRHPALSVIVLPAVLLAGCDDRAAAAVATGTDAGPPPPPAPTATATARPAPSASGSAAADKPELSVLKLVFTSEVKNKEPSDVLASAKPGQRVYAHLTMRNRYPDTRPIVLVFSVNEEERARIDLKVDPSWSYRTWGYVTLRATDFTGDVVAEVRDGGGRLLDKGRLPIRGDSPAKPQSKGPPASADPFND
jgi:hypothetical protein